MTAPTQPRQPITMMMVPVAISRFAAEREGRDDDRVAKFPWVTESHTPTPSRPHPPSCEGEREREKERERERERDRDRETEREK